MKFQNKKYLELGNLLYHVILPVLEVKIIIIRKKKNKAHTLINIWSIIIRIRILNPSSIATGIVSSININLFNLISKTSNIFHLAMVFFNGK